MKFRKAGWDDCEMIYSWSNDPLVRQQSYSSDFISYESHKKWFRQKLNSSDCRFYIFYKDHENLGMVRIERQGTDWVIGINIATEHRGKGYAAEMISMASKDSWEQNGQPVIAYIKKENQASIRSFEKAGYQKHKELDIKNIPSLEYKYEDS